MRHKPILSLAVLLLALLSLSSVCHADLTSEGRSLLFNNGAPTYLGIRQAHLKFMAAVAAEPANVEANFFLSLTRVANAFLWTGVDGAATIETMREMMEAFGCVFAPSDAPYMFYNNNPLEGLPYMEGEVPANAPGGEAIRQFLAEKQLGYIGASIGDLSNIPNNFTLTLTAAETGQEADVHVDYGDVLLYKSFLLATKCSLLMLTSYDFGLDTAELKGMGETPADSFGIFSKLLKKYPTLLNLRADGGTSLQTARSALLGAIGCYLAASDFIGAEEYDPNDLIAFGPEDIGAGGQEENAALCVKLQEIRDSLNETRVAVIGEASLNLNPLFGTAPGPYDLRDLLPKLNPCGRPVSGTWGHGLGNDPTLGGILPLLTQAWYDEQGLEFPACASFMPWIPLLLLDE